jgi:hypothetical protein
MDKKLMVPVFINSSLKVLDIFLKVCFVKESRPPKRTSVRRYINDFVINYVRNDDQNDAATGRLLSRMTMP